MDHLKSYHQAQKEVEVVVSYYNAIMNSDAWLSSPDSDQCLLAAVHLMAASKTEARLKRIEMFLKKEINEGL